MTGRSFFGWTLRHDNRPFHGFPVTAVETLAGSVVLAHRLPVVGFVLHSPQAKEPLDRSVVTRTSSHRVNAYVPDQTREST